MVVQQQAPHPHGHPARGHHTLMVIQQQAPHPHGHPARGHHTLMVIQKQPTTTPSWSSSNRQATTTPSWSSSNRQPTTMVCSSYAGSWRQQALVHTRVKLNSWDELPLIKTTMHYTGNGLCVRPFLVFGGFSWYRTRVVVDHLMIWRCVHTMLGAVDARWPLGHVS